MNHPSLEVPRTRPSPASVAPTALGRHPGGAPAHELRWPRTLCGALLILATGIDLVPVDAAPGERRPDPTHPANAGAALQTARAPVPMATELVNIAGREITSSPQAE